MSTAAPELKLDDVLPRMLAGDVLLYRGSGMIPRLIKAAGRSRFSHVGMFCFCHGEPMVAEIREWVGGRVVSLRDQVRRHPGRIHWFKANGTPNTREKSTRYMVRLAGCDYGYWAVARAALWHMPVMRLLLTRREQTIATREPKQQIWPYCSMAVDAAWAIAGIDLVRNLESKLTEPGDLERSAELKEQGALVL